VFLFVDQISANVIHQKFHSGIPAFRSVYLEGDMSYTVNYRVRPAVGISLEGKGYGEFQFQTGIIYFKVSGFIPDP
jgi:hypothetical protein